MAGLERERGRALDSTLPRGGKVGSEPGLDPGRRANHTYPFVVEPDKRTITDTEHLKGDTEIRDWIGGHDAVTVQGIPTSEKVRLVNRLLDGYVSDDDIDAIEKIAKNAASADRPSPTASIDARMDSLGSVGQRARLRVIVAGLQ